LEFISVRQRSRRIRPLISAASARASTSRRRWFGDAWFQVMDSIDLGEMFEQAAGNRRIAQPRATIATLIFERMRPHFPTAPARGSRRDGAGARPIRRRRQWQHRRSLRRRPTGDIRNHLNCGTVGTLMFGGGSGATFLVFAIPLGSVT
jgi:hypothetical protein